MKPSPNRLAKGAISKTITTLKNTRQKKTHLPLVLAVDDESTQLLWLKMALKGHCELLTCQTKAEAERLFQLHPFDVLLIDIWIGDESGEDLLLSLGGENCTARAIAVTADQNQAVTIGCLKAGFNQFLVKPVPAHVLRHAIEEQFEVLEMKKRLAQEKAQAQKAQDEKKALEMLVHQDRLLGNLISGIGHNINNPNNFITINSTILKDFITAILPVMDRYVEEHGDMMTGLLRYSRLRPKLPSLLEGLQEGARRITEIVIGLKAFSPAPKKNSFEVGDLNAWVSSAMHMGSGLYAGKIGGIDIVLAAKPAMIHGRRQDIEQMVLNLLKNSIDHGGDKEVRITIETKIEPSHHAVLLSLRDQGLGMSQEVLSHAMEPFFTTRREEGFAGLGLSVARQLVLNFQGVIDIKSELGKGTTVEVRFPLAQMGEAIHGSKIF